jgi:hypothetical protein
MVEKRPVIEGETISYDGLFRLKDVYSMITEWMMDNGYVPVEKRVTETVTKSGKHVEVDFEPFKKFSDYAKGVIRIRLGGSNITEVEATIDGQKRKMQKGGIMVDFTSWLETDYEGRWETKPVFYVLRTLFEKYIFTPFLSGFITKVRNDTNDIKERIRAYLNLEGRRQ